MTTIDSTAWLETYKPITNHIDPAASWQDEDGNGAMFETFGEELRFVQSQPNDKVWTYIDSETEDLPVIVSGYHAVNCIGYFVTEVPFTQDTTVILD